MIEQRTKDGGRWMTAATVEKFADVSAHAAARSRWVDLTTALWRRHTALLEAAVQAGDAEGAAEQAALVRRYQPTVEGNTAASAGVRSLIERYWEDAFALEQARGQVIDAKLKLSPEQLRRLVESQDDLAALSALAESEFALGAANGLLNEGINALWELVTFTTTSETRWSAAAAHIGVGNSASAFAATQTDLQGASKSYRPMESGFPTFGTLQKATWKAQWNAGDGNFAWEEWTVCNASSGTGKNLNRKVESLGTKVSGAVWTLEVEVSLS